MGCAGGRPLRRSARRRPGGGRPPPRTVGCPPSRRGSPGPGPAAGSMPVDSSMYSLTSASARPASPMRAQCDSRASSASAKVSGSLSSGVDVAQRAHHEQAGARAISRATKRSKSRDGSSAAWRSSRTRTRGPTSEALRRNDDAASNSRNRAPSDSGAGGTGRSGNRSCSSGSSWARSPAPAPSCARRARARRRARRRAAPAPTASMRGRRRPPSSARRSRVRPVRGPRPSARRPGGSFRSPAPRRRAPRARGPSSASSRARDQFRLLAVPTHERAAPRARLGSRRRAAMLQLLVLAEHGGVQLLELAARARFPGRRPAPAAPAGRPPAPRPAGPAR